MDYDYDTDDYGNDEYEETPDYTTLSVLQVRKRIEELGLMTAIEEIPAHHIGNELLAHLWYEAQVWDQIDNVIDYLRED